MRMARKSMIGAAALTLVGLLVGCALASSQSAKPVQGDRKTAELTRQIESIAANFSSYLLNYAHGDIMVDRD
jgi:ABC-type phosphate transport system substrate-binding protein